MQSEKVAKIEIFQYEYHNYGSPDAAPALSECPIKNRRRTQMNEQKWLKLLLHLITTHKYLCDLCNLQRPTDVVIYKKKF